MLMRDTEIKAALEKGDLVIQPFNAARLAGASYDVCVGSEAYVSNRDDRLELEKNPGTPAKLNGAISP